MSDVSLVTKLIPTVNEGFTTTVGGSGVATGGATVPLTNVSGLTNGSVFVGIIEPGQTNQQTFTGTVDTSGSQITGVVWTRGSNAAHAAGVTVVDYVTGTAINMMGKAFLTEHSQDGTHSSAILNKLYPVGSVYINATNSTNPVTLMGFGTWVAFGPGQTLIGVGTSDQAFAAGATGGESNHLLTSNEMPSHAHPIGQTPFMPSGTGSLNLNDRSADAPMWTDNASQGVNGEFWAGNGGGASKNTSSTGGGTTHNNLPPYIVVYLWRRTA